MSTPTGLIAPPFGGAQPDYIPLFPLGTAAAWPSANQCIWLRFRVDKPTSATGILVPNGSTVNGNIKVGLYDSDRVTLVQRALSAETAMSGASANQAISFAAPYPLSPGQDYYAYMASDSASATFSRLSTAAAAWTLTGREAYVLANAYVTPPTPQTIAGLFGSSYLPSLRVITTG